MNTTLKGKTAIVTGGSQGIGREIGIVLASEGANVMLAARNERGLAETVSIIEKAGGVSRFTVMDVTDDKSVTKMVEETMNIWGSIDILVNNSGIAGPTGNCEDIKIVDWEECIAVNVRGPFLCARAVLPVMKAKRSGKIVNISSITGKKPLVQRTVYATSKLGLIGFTRTLAIETGPYGITVNAISPGAVEGDRIKRVVRAAAESEGRSEEDMREQFTMKAALGRMSKERDIANMVLYLCSDAGANITAQDINVCAGSVWY